MKGTRQKETIKIIRAPQFDHEYDEGVFGMKNRAMPPLALGILTSYLKKNGIQLEQDELDVKTHYDNLYYPEKYISARALHDKRDEIFEYIRGKWNSQLDSISQKLADKTNLKYDLVLISCPPSHDNSARMATLLISNFVKKKYRSIVIVGGIGVEQCWDDWAAAIKYGIIDFIIKGPGEIPLVQLIKTLKNDGDLSRVSGITYLEKGEVFSNPGEDRIIDIIPDFEGLPLDKYTFDIPFFRRYLKKTFPLLTLPFKATFGCPYKCAFCTNSKEQLKYLPPKVAVDILELLSKRHNAKHFFFLDDTFNISKEFAIKFCDEIIKRKLDILWTDCVNFKQADETVLAKMRRAGAVNLVWGIETGSDKLIKYIDKGILPDKALEILKKSHEAGIWNEIEIICGFPHEDDEDVEKTINFLGKVEPYIEAVHPHVFYLDQRSLFYRFPERYGITNIKKLDKSSSHDSTDEFEQLPYHHYYSFDTIDGLSWEGRKLQTVRSFKKITKKISSMDVYNLLTNEVIIVLFYLYRSYGTKEKVKKMFNKWLFERTGQSVFSKVRPV